MSSDLATCHLCGASIKFSEYDAHVDTCSADKVQCPLCFGQFDKSSIERHAASCDGTAPRGPSVPTPATGGGGGGGGGIRGLPVDDTPSRSAGGGFTLCKGGCGFNGQEIFGGYCNKCIYTKAPGAVSGGGSGGLVGGATAPMEKKYVPGEAPATRHTHNAGNGRTIVVRKGDITLEDADCVVNPANKKLDHASGVAGAIRRMGGDIVQDASDIYISEHGEVSTGTAITGPAGDLKCKHLIHAVGPIWDKDDYELQKLCKEQLANAVNASLIEAEKAEATSIAIPAISSGIFGFPRALCAQILFNSVSHYFCQNHNSLIKQVRFTNIDVETVNVFLKLFPKTETTLVRTLHNDKVVRCVRGDHSHYFVGSHIKNLMILDCTSAKNPTVHHAGHDLVKDSMNVSLEGQLKAAQIHAQKSNTTEVLTPLSSFTIPSPASVIITVPLFDVTEDSLKALRSAVSRGIARAASMLPPINDANTGGSIAIPPIGTKSGFSQTIASQIVVEEALKFLTSDADPAKINVREIMLCEDTFSQFFLDMCRKGVDENGKLVDLPPPVLPNLQAPTAAPVNETPAQRRERERALAQARLQMELASQGPVFQ